MKKICLALGLVGGMTIASALPGEVPFDQFNPKYSHQITSIASGDWGSVWIGGDNGAIARIGLDGKRTDYTNPNKTNTAIKLMSYGNNGYIGCVGVVYADNAIYRLCTPDTSKGDGVGWDKTKWESIKNTYAGGTPTALGMRNGDGSVEPLMGFSDGKILALKKAGGYYDYSNATGTGAVISLQVGVFDYGYSIYSNGEIYRDIGSWVTPKGWQQIYYSQHATSIASPSSNNVVAISFDDGVIIALRNGVVSPITNQQKASAVKQLGAMWLSNTTNSYDRYCLAGLYEDGSVYRMCGEPDTWGISTVWKFVAWGM